MIDKIPLFKVVDNRLVDAVKTELNNKIVIFFAGCLPTRYPQIAPLAAALKVSAQFTLYEFRRSFTSKRVAMQSP